MNMSDLLELEDEENQEMGSYNHSLAQAQLTGLFFNDKRFSVFIELSLDVSQTDLSQFGMKTKEELKPDICLSAEPQILSYFEIAHAVARKGLCPPYKKSIIFDNLWFST